MEGPPTLNSLVTTAEDLIVFIDETGHERIAGKDQIFGVGGIIVHGSAYSDAVVAPWYAIRARLCLPPDKPLHAATDFSLYKPLLNDIAAFFKSGAFVRHVSIVTSRTMSSFDPFVTATCGGLARNVGRALARAIQVAPVNRVVYVVEHSQRLHMQYQKLVGPTGPTLLAADGSRRTFPQVWASLRKSSATAGLEVADFVLHAAQAQVKRRLMNPKCPDRQDFHAVFRSVPDHFVEFMQIDDAKATQSVGMPGTWQIALTDEPQVSKV
jgi:hypothetical protein